MNRRDFLLLKVRPGTRVRVLSCEELYMRFLDSQMDGSTDALFARLRSELWQIDRVTLTGPMWLRAGAFRGAIEPVLDAFRARGGCVDTEATPAPASGPLC